MARIVAALVFLVLMLAQVARADDASCYAAGKQQVDKAMATCQDGWPFCALDGFQFKHDAGNVWVAVIDLHYGNSPPGAPSRSTPTFVCNDGETPQPPPDDSCSKVQPYSGAFKGKIASGATMCQGEAGGTGCVMSFKPDSDPFLNRTGTQWATHGTYSPTGSSCTPGQVGGDNGAGPPPDPAPPRSCGDVSCFDSGHNNVCTDNASGSLCLTGPQMNNGGGTCTTLGDNTMCGGSPGAPTPPPPPSSPISDPDHEITGTDHYTFSGPSGNYTTVVTTYGAGQSPSTSGQKPGDDGPAPATSTGGPKGDGTTASGGGDCNSPPVVNGSGGLNAVAYQAWKTRCAVEDNKLGTGTVNTLGTLYTPSTDTTASVVADFQEKVQQAPIASSVTSFFQVNATGGACPVWTMPASQWLPALTFDFYCRPELQDILDWARVVILITCAYVAFQIAMGDS